MPGDKAFLETESWREPRAGHFEGVGVRTKFGGKKLQSYVPAQSFVLGLVDNSHPTSAELVDNTVVRDGLADHGLADHWCKILRTQTG